MFVLLCLFVMISFISWWNYCILERKGSCNISTQHKIKWPLPWPRPLLTLRSRSRGPGHHLLWGSAAQTLLAENLLCSELHFGDSLSQPHNHTTHLDRQFLEMIVSERFIMATNSQQNKRAFENFYQPRIIISIRKQLTLFHQKNPVSKSKT